MVKEEPMAEKGRVTKHTILILAYGAFVVVVSAVICLINSAGIGAFLGGATASAMAFYLMHYYTRRKEIVEGTLHFTSEFQRLLSLHDDLNMSYCFDDQGNDCADIRMKTPTDREILKAWNFFRQYYNLLLQEFVFFERGLLDRETMVEWMKWRWYGWKPERAAQFESNRILWNGCKGGNAVCGTSFQVGWDCGRSVLWCRRQHMTLPSS